MFGEKSPISPVHFLERTNVRPANKVRNCVFSENLRFYLKFCRTLR